MSRDRWKNSWLGWLPALLATAAAAQAQSLTLHEAIDRALGQNPRVAVAKADVQAANADTAMARTALLPRLNLREDLSRGNDPVYVFGTKLRQQRFTQSDFSLDSLNRPPTPPTSPAPCSRGCRRCKASRYAPTSP